MAITHGDLSGTKDESNDAFTIPVVPIANSVQIIYDGSVLKPVGSFSLGVVRNMECIISGQNVQVGLPPKAGTALWFICDV